MVSLANTDMDGSASHHSRYIVANVNVPYGYWSYRYQFYRNNKLQPFYASGQQYRMKAKIPTNSWMSAA
ncbi:hypothetical protein J4727_12570 [Providencia rettgeri]|uniref:Uncharacterized protein n=1 Tax=Providencia rettgeri TaxID=587 RepID=A0A939SQV8_PRORE|nr:hypothetical protein [Providencia rettgeri]